MKKGLASAYCPTLSALYEVAASVKENLQEFIMEPRKIRKVQEVEGVTEFAYHTKAGKRKLTTQPAQMMSNHQNHQNEGRPQWNSNQANNHSDNNYQGGYQNNYQSRNNNNNGGHHQGDNNGGNNYHGNNRGNYYKGTVFKYQGLKRS